eukprot:CAMPEP_0113674386 /NCGR_PEP_ID=MMETSP0038_2-20120614/7386_1 /TAXON_ID=2898 /ORGANISM="Cryptomonas paramecium" /LENGTH=618 /DNA_ID=CAMNT_0000590953 /DNA_START=66 /DNA_END=1918 /DNA_ORIENTATION=- /assembly_acc=CAM_ASM_000170
MTPATPKMVLRTLGLRGGSVGVSQSQANSDEVGAKTEGGAAADSTSPLMDPSLVEPPPVVSRGNMFRTCSYSVLDERRVTEPGFVHCTDAVGNSEDKSIVFEATSTDAQRAESEAFCKLALEQAQSTSAQNTTVEDRVAAALHDSSEPFKRLNVVLVSSELARYAKSGGLADVTDKLSIALARRGHRVMTVVPMYGYYDGVVASGVKRAFGMFGCSHPVEYFHKWEPCGVDAFGNETGVDRIFVEQQCFRRPGMYGEWGRDYGDNLFRFGLFAWASIEAPLCMPAVCPFGEDVVYIANDWQTGLVPLILTSHYRRWRCLGNARCIFVVHNMGYHGVYPNPPTWTSPRFSFQDMGLRDDAYYDRYVWTFPIEERPSKGRDPRDTGEAIKLLRGGIEMADRVVTVAPTYKDEIQSLEGGFGMHEAARARSYHLDGILNGIDVEEWDPTRDPHISHHFSVDDPSNKTNCKRTLQYLLGLEQKPDTPLVAFIGRLAYQKGVDLIEQVLGWLMGGDHLGVTGDVQLVMMGSGEGRYCEFLKNAEASYRGRVVGYVGFTPEMEHKIIAGADILIMPSRYEPCGLPQMYAQRYGTVPVVHATGGLKDSVVQYNPFADSPAEEPAA